MIIKTRPVGGKSKSVRQPLGIALRRRPYHTGQANPHTLAPLIHIGTVAHVRTTTTGAGP